MLDTDNAGGGVNLKKDEKGNIRTPRTFSVEFTGKASEFFRIWIVNLFLSIVTLSIYSAWAKVRTRRYFYAHTSFAGHPFDYLASPINILIGHLIVGVLFIAYSVSGQFNSTIAAGFIIFFYLILPFLIYKSVRFYAHNSAYRGIRFRFDGTLWESYQLYLLAPILIPLTLGLYFPYWAYLQKRWFYENMAFGEAFNEFDGRPGPFYKTYFLALLQIILLVAVFSAAAVLVALAAGASDATGAAGRQMFMQAGVIAAVGMYIVVLIGTAIVQQYIFARIFNYCWQQSQIGPVRVRSTLKARRLFWIRFTNILAIIISLGMLIPWAKVRRVRYMTSCMTVEVAGDFDEFTAASGKDVSALGDAATDFFDFDIGL